MSNCKEELVVKSITTIVLILLITVSAKNIFQPDITFSELQQSYIGNLLKVYENFTFVFHIENASVDHSYSIYKIYTNNVRQTTLMYNYDCTGNENIIRQYGAKFINLVIMGDIFKFQKFSDEPGRMAVNDIILLFLYGNYNDEDIEEWVRMGLHPFVGNILILDLRTPHWIMLNSTLFYAVKGTRIRGILQSTNSSNVAVPQNLLLPKTFENLGGFLLHIGFADYFPYIHCEKYQNGTLSLGDDEVKVCGKAVGAEAELLKVLSFRMNFTYKLLNYPGKSHAELFNKVAEKKIDFAVGGITRTYNRVLNATFTISHITEGLTFLYVYHVDPLSYLLIFFFPFEWELWLLLIFVIVLISMLTYIIINCDLNKKEMKISIYRSTMASINAIIEQMVILDPKFFKQKQILYVVHVTWWFTCIWLTTYYKGKLASLYIRPPHEEPSSLKQIVDDGYQITVNSMRAAAIKELYQFGNDELTQKAAENTVYIKGLCSVLNYTLTHKSAMLTEFAQARYHTQILCPNLIGPHNKLHYDQGRLRIVTEPLIVIPHGWPLPKGTPFTFPINMYKLRLRDAGFIKQWIRLSVTTRGLWSIKNARNNSAIRNDNDRVSVTLYLSAFLILAVGYIISIPIFIIEMRCRRTTQN